MDFNAIRKRLRILLRIGTVLGYSIRAAISDSAGLREGQEEDLLLCLQKGSGRCRPAG